MSLIDCIYCLLLIQFGVIGALFRFFPLHLVQLHIMLSHIWEIVIIHLSNKYNCSNQYFQLWLITFAYSVHQLCAFLLFPFLFTVTLCFYLIMKLSQSSLNHFCRSWRVCLVLSVCCLCLHHNQMRVAVSSYNVSPFCVSLHLHVMANTRSFRLWSGVAILYF